MKLLELEITAFMAIESAKLKLDDRGLVVIQGINKDDSSADSNGAGKSSLADAIDWVLYGETARGISGDDVVNNVLKKGTRVALTIQDGASTYIIARHRKHKEKKNALTLSLFDGFTEKDLTKGTDKLTQEEVNKIIGSSHAVFRASIYAGQEQMPDLPAMTDKNLKVLIEEAAGTAVLEAAYKAARENVLLANTEVTTKEAFIGGLQTGLQYKKDEIAGYKTRASDFDTERRTKIADLQARAGAVIADAKKIEESIAAGPDEIATRAEIADLDAKIAAVNSEIAESQRLNGVVHQKDGELRGWLRQKEVYEGHIRAIEQEIANIDHKVGCPCDRCGRPLTDAEMAGVKSELDKSLAEAKTKLDATLRTVDAATVALQEAVDAFEAYKAGMTDLTAVSARRRELLGVMADITRMQGERQATLTMAQTIKSQIEDLKKQVNPFDAAIMKAEVEQGNIEVKIAAEKIKLKELEEAAMIEAEVSKIFSPVGVRAHILDEVTPYLNAQTAAYLSTLSDGNIEATWSTVTYNKKGEGKERFAIDVAKKKGASLFNGLSGGEKRKVRLATAMALQDLVATRATKPIGLFIADEIDDAIDTAGLERLMSILTDKAKQCGSVFIISHNDLADWVSQAITVTMSGGVATVTEATT